MEKQTPNQNTNTNKYWNKFDEYSNIFTMKNWIRNKIKMENENESTALKVCQIDKLNGNSLQG